MAHRASLRLTGSSDVANGNGTFNLTKWKAALDRYAGVDLSSFVGDGTIAGHYDAAYFGRSDVKGAVETLAGQARARAATSCRVRS